MMYVHYSPPMCCINSCHTTQHTTQIPPFHIPLSPSTHPQCLQPPANHPASHPSTWLVPTKSCQTSLTLPGVSRTGHLVQLGRSQQRHSSSMSSLEWVWGSSRSFGSLMFATSSNQGGGPPRAPALDVILPQGIPQAGPWLLGCRRICWHLWPKDPSQMGLSLHQGHCRAGWCCGEFTPNVRMVWIVVFFVMTACDSFGRACVGKC